MLEFMDKKHSFMNQQSDAAQAVIIPYGLEASVSYEGGTKHGPRAILDASPELEFFDEFFLRECFQDYGLNTLNVPEIPTDLQAALDYLAKLVETALTQKHFPLILGGEHSLTAGAIRPFVKHHETLTILQFDAHADLRDGYLDEHYSHAAAMRRCLDHPNVRLISLGIRNIAQEEYDFYQKHQDRINIFWAHQKNEWDMQKLLQLIGDDPVYLTFDVDAFDSSLMPATGTPEPGGLFWDDVIPILDIVSQNAQIVGADIVELAPRSGLHACDFVAAKLAYKILNFVFRKHYSETSNF